MPGRRRGEHTKERVLRAACKTFAEKGFRDATHADISRRAGANTAAINYYFTSKEGLYRAAFERLSQRVERLHPLDGGLPSTAPPVERLRAYVHAHLRRLFDPELMGDLHRIRMAEVFDPTGVLDDLLAAQLASDRRQIQEILRELLGPTCTQRDVDWCEMSVMSQCLVAGPGPPDLPPDRKPAVNGPRSIFGLDGAEVDRLTEHIVQFSLAGIAAIAQRAASGSGDSTGPKRANRGRVGQKA